MKLFFEKIKSRAQLRSLVALSLGALSLVVLLVGFQLNFQQQKLYTQVIQVSDRGVEEMMIFRDYRESQIENVKKLLSDCLERNELFGDGTGEVCTVHRSQLSCVSSSNDQEQVLTCFE